MATAIRAEQLSKVYRIGAAQLARYRTLRESIMSTLEAGWARLGGSKQNTSEPQWRTHWALRNVDLEVKTGEVVGIIGRNGAGKSTLLKILTRITEPTSGRASLRGRVASLLEVGTGFHQELSGRENIFLNGSILGMTRREIQRKFDEIVAFSEIDQFLDTPVKRYSSGMYVRLAFAVAAHLDPGVLIVDEVLAVGDGRFQKKCLGKLEEFGHEGRTVLIVSHNMSAIRHLCTRAVLFASGQIIAEGATDSVILAYERDAAMGNGALVQLTEHQGRTPASTPTMTQVKIVDDADGHSPFVAVFGTVRIEVEFTSANSNSDVTFGFVVKTTSQVALFGSNTNVCPVVAQEGPVKAGKVVATIPDVPLMPGTYLIDLYFGSNGRHFDVIFNAAELTVVAADPFGSGRLPPPHYGNVCWPAKFQVQGIA